MKQKHGAQHEKQKGVTSTKKPSLITAVKFNSPSFKGKQNSSSSSIQFYKSPTLVTNQKDESSLGSLLKKMKEAQAPNVGKLLETRDEIAQRIQTLLKLGAKRGKDFVIGFNSISKLVEMSSEVTEKHISVVVVSSDAKGELVHSLGQVAARHHIPIVLLPKLSPKLQESFQLKRAFCFALRTAESEATASQGGLDDLREYLLRLSRQ